MTDSPTDPQSTAFREATELDWDTHQFIDHPDGTVDDIADPQPSKTREDYEAEGWDSDAQPAKTRDQARDALTARINDPAAPDTENEARSYETDHDEQDGE